MQITQRFTMDMASQTPPPILDAMQNDTNTRVLEISLLENGNPWGVPTGVTAALAFKKSDGHKGFYDALPDGKSAIDIQGNKVTAVLIPQALTCCGEVRAAIVFHTTDLDQLTTFPFRIRVIPNPAAGEVVSNDYYSYTTMAEVNQAMDAFFTQAEENYAFFTQGIEARQEAFLKTASQALAEMHNAVTANAPGVVCDAEGQFLSLKDASDLPLAGLRIFGKTKQFTTTGKNLLENTAKSYTTSGVTFTVRENGSIAINGTNTSTAAMIYGVGSFLFKAGIAYYLSGCDDSVLWMDARDETDTIVDAIINQTGDTPVNFDNDTQLKIYIRVPGSATINNRVVYPMIRLASVEDATYEPYTGGMPSPNPDYPQELVSPGSGGSVGVNVCGKNLIKNTAATLTKNGITFTINDDGSVTANGTATARADCTVCYPTHLVAGEKYILTGCPAGGERYTYNLGYTNNVDHAYMDYGDGVECEGFDLSVYPKPSILLAITSGVTVSNLVFKPMIRSVSVKDDTYEPYKGQTLDLSTPTGLPGIPVSSGGNYTDAHGQQWICDEVDFARGVYVQRVAKIQPPSFTLSSIGSTLYRMHSIYYGIPLKPRVGLCNITTHSGSEWGTSEGLAINTIEPNGAIYINLPDKFKTADEINAYVAENPIVILAALATPIESPLSAEEIAAFKALHTNKPNTTVYTDSNAGIKLDYVADTKTYIDNKFAELAAAIVNNT